MNQNKLFQTLVSKEAAEFSGEAGEFRCLSRSGMPEIDSETAGQNTKSIRGQT